LFGNKKKLRHIFAKTIKRNRGLKLKSRFQSFQDGFEGVAYNVLKDKRSFKKAQKIFS